MTKKDDKLLRILNDDSSTGIFIIDKIDTKTFTKFRNLSRKKFKNNDGETLKALMEKHEGESKS